MSKITVRGLSKRFGTVLAVSELSFTVEGGAVLGFLGPNGAGKTTTMRMLLGLVRPTAGAATIDGSNYRDLKDPLRHVGAVLESSGFHPSRTARDHLRVQATAGGLEPGRVDSVLERVGLSESAHRRVGGFSLGMRQRLGLAGALLGDPGVLILDEPANGLDPEGVRWLRELLRELADEGRAVLISSHILAEISQTVDSVCILDRGRLVTQANLDDLTRGAQRVVRVRTPRAQELRVAVTATGAECRPMGDDRLEVTGATNEQVGTIAAGLGIPIFELTSEASSLEDVFLSLTTLPPAQEAAK
ncbi:MAG: ABC transporter ATP-binding protein [Candidatus Dormibacteria bacterium]